MISHILSHSSIFRDGKTSSQHTSLGQLVSSKWPPKEISGLNSPMVLQQRPLLGQEHHAVMMRSIVPQRAWVVPITNWSQPETVAKSKAATPPDDSWSLNPAIPDDGHSNYPHTGKRNAHPLPARQPLMLINNYKSSH